MGIRKVFIIVFLFGLGISVSWKNAYAGSINMNEQNVIGVAEGTFQYEGTMYSAKAEYVNQLKSKFSSDSVDLTARQAQAAISGILNHIQVGVEKGYIVPLPKASSNKEKVKQEASKKKTLRIVKRVNKLSITEVNTSENSAEDTMYHIAPSLKGTVFPLNPDKVEKKWEETSATSSQEIRKWIFTQYERLIRKILFCFVGCIFVIGIVAFIYRRGRIEAYIVAFLGTIMIGGGTLILVISMGLQGGIVSKNLFTQAIIETNYFKKSYEEIHQKIIKRMEETGVPMAVLERAITEEAVYREGKNLLEATFANKKFQVLAGERFEKELTAYMKEGEFSNQWEKTVNVKKLSVIVQQTYVDEVTISYAQQLMTIREVYLSKLYILMGLSGSLCLLVIIFLLVSRTSAGRILCILMKGLGISMVAIILGIVLSSIVGKEEVWNIQPRYYYDLIKMYLSSSIQIFYYLIGMEALLMVLLFTILRYLRRNVNCK